MTIGFSNGDFYRLYQSPNERFSRKYIKLFELNGATNALELTCINPEMIDYLLKIKNFNLAGFNYVSLHCPILAYQDDQNTNRFLSKLRRLKKKFAISNFVFHPDKVVDWRIFKKYQDLSIAIENMDNRKSCCRTVKDLKSVLIKNPHLNLVLDLQHCYVNDSTMKLAGDFQRVFKNKIVEYHLSGADENLYHYSLFKTKQNKIIDSLLYKDIPIIIEGAFAEIGDQEKELAYTKERIFSSRLKIKKSKIAGQGVFAVADIKKGETALILNGEAISLEEMLKRVKEGKEEPSDPLQIGAEDYFDLDELSRAINHSCAPNTYVKGKSELIALKNIKPGEEITFDYSLTMDDNEAKIKRAGREMWTCKCNCGANNCRGIINEFKNLPDKVRTFYIKNRMLPDFMLKKFG